MPFMVSQVSRGRRLMSRPRQSCLILSRKITLESLNILTLERRRVMVVYDRAAWLQAMDKRILLWQLPIEVRILIPIPPSIKPDTSHLTVVGKKFCKLVVHKLIVALPVTLWVRGGRYLYLFFPKQHPHDTSRYESNKGAKRCPACGTHPPAPSRCRGGKE